MAEESSESSQRFVPPGREGWGRRVVGGTAVGAGIGAVVGMLFGLLGKGRSVPRDVASVSANYALAGTMISGFSEVTRELLSTDPESLANVVVGGFATGAIFARLGRSNRPIGLGLLFSSVGVTVQLAASGWQEYRLRRFLENLPDEAFPDDILKARKQAKAEAKRKTLNLPDWFPIKVMSKEEEERRNMSREQ